MKKLYIFFVATLLTVSSLIAQEKDDNAASEAQANNPLANMTAFTNQYYFNPKLENAPSGSYMNTMSFKSICS